MISEPLPNLVCPRIADIREAVCKRYSVTMAELLSEQRARYIARPRQIGMYLARRMTLRSLPEIGRQFGDRDHTTVMHAAKTVERLCAEDEEIAEDVLLLEISLTATARNRARVGLFA